MMAQARRMLTPQTTCKCFTSSRRNAGFMALADHVLEHLLVQGQIRHQASQTLVLFLKLLEPLHLRRHESAVLVAPAVVRLGGDAGLAVDLFHGRPFLGLAQDEGDL